MADSIIRVLHEQLITKQRSSTELTKAYLAAIKRDNAALNAYVAVTADAALAAAAAVDARIARGEDIPLLAGIPMSLKDNISTAGIHTGCCSRMLESYTPIYDATVWSRLSQAGAVLLGKTNMDEFAMGSSTETSCFGGTKNPYDTSRVAGGSSGGAAAAVAAGLCAYALGSDTGGSIRQPASFCGAVGVKPTYGAVSRYGLIAYASSFDQIGPVANTVTDAAIVLDAITGADPMDGTSCGTDRVLSSLEGDIRGMRIGVCDAYMQAASDEVRAAMEAAVETFRALGGEIVQVQLPHLSAALPLYYILTAAEASSNLGRYDGIRYGYRTDSYASVDEMICKTRSEGFGDEVKRRILLGTYVLSAGYYDAYYKKAQAMREAVRRDFAAAFERCDVMLTPTVPQTAFLQGFAAQDPVTTYQTDICTVPVNVAGLPAVSLPCGVDANGLPVGVQLIGNHFCEADMLRAARQFEAASDIALQHEWGVRV